MKKYQLFAKIALTAVFAISLYVFWALPYRSALSYQEQFQLFLIDGGYLAEHLVWPGGISTYISEFLVQLYNNYWIGALVISLIMVGVQLLVYALARTLSRPDGLMPYILSFVPAIALWMYTGDINHMPSVAVSVLIALGAALCYARIRPLAARIVFAAIGIPAVYWLSGTSVYLFAALVCIAEIRRGLSRQSVVMAVCACLLTMLAVWICTWFVSYSPAQIFIGINFYRQPEILPVMLVVLWATVAATVAVCAYLPRTGIVATSVAGVLVAAAAWIGVSASFDTRVHDLVEYDYMLRTGDWQGIIAKSERHNPDTPLAVCSTNLALGMTDQLTTRAFEFYQNGPDGLFPTFNLDGNTAMVLSELYFRLGMINSAQRLAFEAMESNPNYKKSARYIKRLAETNLIRGNKAVAAKYLKLLDKTMMYGKWAERTRALLYDDAAIDSHPLYGRLRRLQVDDDFLFSETETDKIIGRLYMSNPDNSLAMQYLLLYPLLERNLDKFMQYLQVVQERTPVRTPLCQQAVAFAYVQAGKDVPRGVIDPAVMSRFRDFATTMTTSGKDSPALDQFRGTLWYYLVKGQ